MVIASSRPSLQGRQVIVGCNGPVGVALMERLAARLLEAHRSGQVEVAMVRASDFYGPRVRYSALGERVFARALEGRPSQVLGLPNQPHTYTYVEDFARALVTVAGSDDDLGQAWHVPNAPIRTTREIVDEVFGLVGHEARIQALRQPLLSLLSLFDADVRELREMMYQWVRPFGVAHEKFAARFWSDATPWARGLRATIEWYRSASA